MCWGTWAGGGKVGESSLVLGWCNGEWVDGGRELGPK